METVLLQQIRDLLTPRNPLDRVAQISSTQPYILDYQNRKHVYIYSPNNIVISCEDLGNIFIPSNVWIDISFKTGMYIYAVNQVNPIPIFIKCSDDEFNQDNYPLVAIANLSSVASSANSVVLLAQNYNRKTFYVYNDSTQVLYLALASTASTTTYTLQIPSGGFYEAPISPLYTGVVSGIWASANGNARLTEMV